MQANAMIMVDVSIARTIPMVIVANGVGRVLPAMRVATDVIGQLPIHCRI
jgi:hypothetical protein